MKNCCILDSQLNILYAGQWFRQSIGVDANTTHQAITKTACYKDLVILLTESNDVNTEVPWVIGSINYALQIKRIDEQDLTLWVIGLWQKRYNFTKEFLQDTEQDANIGGWSIDYTDDALFWSPKVFEIYGLPKDTPVTIASGLAQYSDASQAILDTCLKQAREGQYFSEELDFYDANNQYKRVHVVGRPVFGEANAVIGLKGSIQDITQPYFERQRNQFAVEACEIGVWELDQNSNLFWNAQMALIYEIQDYAKLTHKDWADAVYISDKEAVEKQFLGPVKNSEPYEYEFRIVGKQTGNVKYIRALAKHYFDQNGNLERTVGVNIDVSAEKMKQQEEMLRKAKDIQKSKYIALGELAAGIGHEINNPLSILNGCMALLREEITEPETRAKELFGNIQQCIKRIDYITAGLRRLVRDDSLESYQSIDLVVVVATTASLLREILSKQGIQLITSMPEQAWVNGHFSELQQVILNLLSNAKDAVASCAKKQIHIDVSASSEQIKVSVKDSGVGIDTDKQRLIFDSIYTDKPSGKGTGLGLGLCKRIVEEHGGVIHVNSKPGEGACFDIVLPRLDPERLDNDLQVISARENNASTTLIPETNNNSQFPVLVVDDEPMILQILEAYLEKQGYPCFGTSSGTEAIEAAKSGLYKLIITDVCMPGFSGVDLLGALSELGMGVPVIVITGGVVEHSIEQEFKDVITSILFKPFNEAELIKEVEKCRELAR